MQQPDAQPRQDLVRMLFKAVDASLAEAHFKQKGSRCPVMIHDLVVFKLEKTIAEAVSDDASVYGCDSHRHVCAMAEHELCTSGRNPARQRSG